MASVTPQEKIRHISPTSDSPQPTETKKHQPPAVMESLEDMVAGSIAGIVGKYIEYPFDTVKVRLQAQPDGRPLRYAGPLDCFRQSVKAEGVIGGLYRGITAPLVGAALENSSLFFFERMGRELVHFLAGTGGRDGAALPLSALYFTGAFAGVFTSFVLTPVELVKCKIQAPAAASGNAASAAPLRPLAVIRGVYRAEGLLAFWHGQLGTLIREGGGGAAWFGAKETATRLFRHCNAGAATSEADRAHMPAQPLPLWQQAVAGAAGGVSYNFLFFPADTVKSRMQTTAIGESAKGRSFRGEATALWRQHGVRGLYRGCGITCLRSAPSSAFIFMAYDGLKQQFQRMHQ